MRKNRWGAGIFVAVAVLGITLAILDRNGYSLWIGLAVSLGAGYWISRSGIWAWTRAWFGLATYCYVMTGLLFLRMLVLPAFLSLVVLIGRAWISPFLVVAGLLCTVAGTFALGRALRAQSDQTQ